MTKEYGMDDFNDRWDWQPKRGHQIPDKTNGTQIPAEFPAQNTVDIVPEVVKTSFIEAATWLIQNKTPEELTPAEASTIKRGSMYLAQRIPRIPTSEAIQTPTTKLAPEKSNTVTVPARASREVILSR